MRYCKSCSLELLIAYQGNLKVVKKAMMKYLTIKRHQYYNDSNIKLGGNRAEPGGTL
jgi:hypothetical protein